MKNKAVIEIHCGSRFKYEMDPTYTHLTLNRVLEIPYPANYGYFPDTMAPDGDPLDLFVLGSPIVPLTHVEVEILGVIEMIDNGKRDDKIIARVINDSVEFDSFFLENITRFLRTYKDGTEVISHGDEKRAIEILKGCSI